ncbi:MAG: hypothetical protein LBI13_00450 [Streptococcaceae bacterium]|nr:hypothetical protein [Streptococcaceae bacterium]
MNKILNEIIGLKVNEAISGGGAGSILKIKLGNGTHFMIYTEWRIEKEGKIIVTSYDSIDPDEGLIPQKIKELSGKEIEKVELTQQNDLMLHFSQGYLLHVFSLVSYSDTSYIGHNWEYNIPDKNLSLVVDRNFELKVEGYDE